MRTVVMLVSTAMLLIGQSTCIAKIQGRYYPTRYNSSQYAPQQPFRYKSNRQPLGKPSYILNRPTSHTNPAQQNRSVTPIRPNPQNTNSQPLSQPNRLSNIQSNPDVPRSPSTQPAASNQTPADNYESPTATRKTEQPANTSDAVNKYKLHPRLVAEFEPQRAIIASVCDLQPQHQHVLKQIIEKSAGHAEILVLFNNNQQLKSTIDLFRDSVSKDLSHVSFYQLELDTVWLRDFGPLISEDGSGTRALDFYYYGVRPNDDSFPERWTLETAGKLTKIPWTIQGGNLLTNGQGLGITTSKIFEDNKVSFPGTGNSGTGNYRNANNEGDQFILRELKKYCNLKDLLVLEPLQNESTKHVDMFAALLAPDHVLIADVNARQDPANARILDWNANKLAAVTVKGKPMRVDRIQIPPRDGDAWSTYTNAIFTDRLVLVPTMTTDDPHYVSRAVAQYRKLLPDHHIATVDITSMKQLQGSLHCMTLNLPAFAPLPGGTISFEQATEIARRTPDPPKNNQASVKNPKQFPIDKQLRRVFQSSTSDYLVDAYAVGLTGDSISLLRVDNRKVVRVRLTGVCDADRYWIQRNANKIRTNGPHVQRLVLSGI